MYYIILLYKKGAITMNIKKFFESKNSKKYNEYIEKALDEAEKELENPNTVFLTHKEIFEKLRNEINKK